MNDIFKEAENIIKTRKEWHGDPLGNFAKTASFWSGYLGIEITPVDVAMMMCLMKISRFSHSLQYDNLVDIAGYAKIASMLKESKDE